MKRKLMAVVPMLTMVMPMTVFATSSTSNVQYGDVVGDTTEKVNVTVSQGSSFTVTIPKNISLAGAKGAANESVYNVTVKGNISSDEVVSVVPSASFALKDVKNIKDDLTANVTQSVQKFVDAKTKESKYGSDNTVVSIGETTTGKVSVANLTAGSWAGEFDFVIKLTKTN